MGALVNRRSTTCAMWVVTAAISTLNVYLIWRVVAT